MQVRDTAAVERVSTLAAALRDPAGLTPVSTGCKLRGSGTVRCAQAVATTPADTLRLAVATRDALIVAAGIPADLRCTPVERPVDVAALGAVRCLVQIEVDGHALSVSVDTLTERRNEQVRVTASNYLVQAS